MPGMRRDGRPPANMGPEQFPTRPIHFGSCPRPAHRVTIALAIEMEPPYPDEDRTFAISSHRMLLWRRALPFRGLCSDHDAGAERRNRPRVAPEVGMLACAARADGVVSVR